MGQKVTEGGADCKITIAPADGSTTTNIVPSIAYKVCRDKENEERSVVSNSEIPHLLPVALVGTLLLRVILSPPHPSITHI